MLIGLSGGLQGARQESYRWDRSQIKELAIKEGKKLLGI